MNGLARYAGLSILLLVLLGALFVFYSLIPV